VTSLSWSGWAARLAIRLDSSGSGPASALPCSSASLLVVLLQELVWSGKSPERDTNRLRFRRLGCRSPDLALRSSCSSCSSRAVSSIRRASRANQTAAKSPTQLDASECAVSYDIAALLRSAVSWSGGPVCNGMEAVLPRAGGSAADRSGRPVRGDLSVRVDAADVRQPMSAFAVRCRGGAPPTVGYS